MKPMKPLCAAVSCLLLGAMSGVPASAQDAAVVQKLSLSAEQAFEKGLGGQGVQKHLSGQGVVLYDQVLIEDDGPGIGSDSQWLKKGRDPVETVAGPVWIKKVLHVERPGAAEARLYLRRGAKRIEVNGQPIAVNPSAEYPPVPVSLLKEGDNEVVVRCDGNDSVSIKIAPRADIVLNAPERRGNPPRSFRSADGGKTWEAIDGEYLVRLHLRQPVPAGEFISPSIDLGGSAGSAVRSGLTVHSVSLTADAEMPRGGSVDLTVRTGPCPVYEESLWTKWQPAGSPVPPAHRYLQWKAALATTDPAASPRLKTVTVEAKVTPQAPPAWAGRVTLAGARNEEIRYTSIPFRYEDFHHPKLVELRRKHKLDEVVSAGQSELEKLVMLKDWVARQWKFHPPSDHYPAWDALEILDRKDGFCVQYAVVYVQCCMSLGYPARFVFGHQPGLGSGHEVAEVWSNEHRKWVFMDPSANLHHVDPNTLEPLSMLEVHDRMIQAFYGDKEAVAANRPRDPVFSDRIATLRRQEMAPPAPPTAPASQPATARRPSWPPYYKWYYVRYMPRNDWYAQPHPMPKIQGWNWDWTGYWNWADPRIPLEWEYRHYTFRRSDVDWTINQVRFDAAWGSQDGAIDVQMGTVTPGLATFLVNVDGAGWTESARTFQWRLHPGRNRLQMRVRNTAAVEGPVSHLELDYAP